MKVNIIFGTESGGGELTAEDIAETLSNHHEVTIENMCDVDVNAIDCTAFYVIVCSTYGEGELPFSAKPFHAALASKSPDLSSLQYAVLGRGDSAYLKTYSRGSEIIDEMLTELGAVRVGTYGRHDDSDWDASDDLAIEWAEGLLSLIPRKKEMVSS